MCVFKCELLVRTAESSCICAAIVSYANLCHSCSTTSSGLCSKRGESVHNHTPPRTLLAVETCFPVTQQYVRTIQCALEAISIGLSLRTHSSVYYRIVRKSGWCWALFNAHPLCLTSLFFRCNSTGFTAVWVTLRWWNWLQEHAWQLSLATNRSMHTHTRFAMEQRYWSLG